MIVVADTTPLISLMKIEKLDILEKMFHEIQIPTAVFDELVSAERFQNEAEIIRNSTFIHVRSVDEPQAVERLRKERELDLGESEAIVLTEQLQADVLIVDEAAARAVAKSLGLSITGTIGILIEAYYRKMLSDDQIIACVEG